MFWAWEQAQDFVVYGACKAKVQIPKWLLAPQQAQSSCTRNHDHIVELMHVDSFCRLKIANVRAQRKICEQDFFAFISAMGIGLGKNQIIGYYFNQYCCCHRRVNQCG